MYHVKVKVEHRKTRTVSEVDIVATHDDSEVLKESMTLLKRALKYAKVGKAQEQDYKIKEVQVIKKIGLW
jgi:hypothetical protein